MTPLMRFSTDFVSLLTLCAFPLCEITTTVAASSGVTTTGNSTIQTLTPELVEWIQGQVDTKVLPGVAVAVVHDDGSLEYGNWGVRTEDGVNMTSDVSVLKLYVVIVLH